MTAPDYDNGNPSTIRVTIDHVDEESGATEQNRFLALAAALVAVPKAEIDAERARTA